MYTDTCASWASLTLLYFWIYWPCVNGLHIDVPPKPHMLHVGKWVDYGAEVLISGLLHWWLYSRVRCWEVKLGRQRWVTVAIPRRVYFPSSSLDLSLTLSLSLSVCLSLLSLLPTVVSWALSPMWCPSAMVPYLEPVAYGLKPLQTMNQNEPFLLRFVGVRYCV